MADLRKLKEITKELERQRDILTRHNETAKSYIQAQKAIKSISADIVNLEEKRDKAADRATKEANTLNIEKQILKLKNYKIMRQQYKRSICSTCHFLFLCSLWH